MATPLIFRPAVKLMSNLNFTIKFTMIIIIFTLPLTVLGLALVEEVQNNIKTSKIELKGLKVVKYTYELLFWVADFRDYAMLQRVNSSPTIKAISNDKKKLVNQSLSELKSYLIKNHLVSDKIQAQVDKINRRWQVLSNATAGVQGGPNIQFFHYDEIVQEMEILVRAITYDSKLAHDPNLTNFFLINMLLNDIPLLNRNLGRLRAYGSYALSMPSIDFHSYTLLDQVYDDLIQATSLAEYSMAFVKDTALEDNAELASYIDNTIDKSHELMDYFYINIIEADTIKINWQDFFSYSSSTLITVYQFSQKIIPLVEEKLEEHIKQQENKLILFLSFSILLYLFVTYLVIGVYYSLQNTISQFSSKAQQLADGDLNIQITYKTHDEMQHVFSAFNKMAHQLRENQNKLVEAEKMASMGRLISGVAHEMNTPLGIAITSSSHMSSQFKSYQDTYFKGAITKEDFEQMIDMAIESSLLIDKNLNRCSGLIETFKQLNSYHKVDVLEDINFNRFCEQLIKTISSNNNDISFELPTNTEVIIKTDRQLLEFIFNNIIDNCISHGLNNNAGLIKINVKQSEHETCIKIQDDGRGLTDEEAKNIFDPFYTTARNKGKVGLGMHIVYIIVTQSLYGSLSVETTQKRGTAITLCLPH